MRPNDHRIKARLGDLCRNFPGIRQRRCLVFIPEADLVSRKELLSMIDYQPGVVVTDWLPLEECGYIKVTVVVSLCEFLTEFCQKYGGELIEERFPSRLHQKKKKKKMKLSDSGEGSDLQAA